MSEDWVACGTSHAKTEGAELGVTHIIPKWPISWYSFVCLQISPVASFLIIYYIADLPVTRLRLLTNKSDNIAVPYASLRSLILLLSSLSFAFLTRFYEAREMSFCTLLCRENIKLC